MKSLNMQSRADKDCIAQLAGVPAITWPGVRVITSIFVRLIMHVVKCPSVQHYVCKALAVFNKSDICSIK